VIRDQEKYQQLPQFGLPSRPQIRGRDYIPSSGKLKPVENVIAFPDFLLIKDFQPFLLNHFLPKPESSFWKYYSSKIRSHSPENI
jgi:hypothetical protein